MWLMDELVGKVDRSSSRDGQKLKVRRSMQKENDQTRQEWRCYRTSSFEKGWTEASVLRSLLRYRNRVVPRKPIDNMAEVFSRVATRKGGFRRIWGMVSHETISSREPEGRQPRSSH